MSEVADVLSIVKFLYKLGGKRSSPTFFGGSTKNEFSEDTTEKFKRYADDIKAEVKTQSGIPLLERCIDMLHDAYSLLITKEPFITAKDTRAFYNSAISFLNKLDIDQSTAYFSMTSDPDSPEDFDSWGYVEMEPDPLPLDERAQQVLNDVRVLAKVKKEDRVAQRLWAKGQKSSDLENGYVWVDAKPDVFSPKSR